MRVVDFEQPTNHRPRSSRLEQPHFQGKRLIRQNGVSKQNSKRGFSLDSDEFDVQVMDKEISLKIEKYFFEINFAGYIQTMTIICSRKINSSSNYKNVVDF